MTDYLPNQKYRHYKGGFYLLLTEACREDNRDEVVMVYRNVETGETWVRPKAEFTELVEWEGERVPRFSRVVS